MEDRCPKCGYGIMGTSEEPPGIHYLCGTWFIDGRLRERTLACYKKEIANLQARLKDAEKRLEAWREYAQELAGLVPRIYRVQMSGLKKLNDLGE